MPGFTVTARFSDSPSAAAAQRTLSAAEMCCHVASDGAEPGKREARFMGRIVILIALWSVFGTALGAGLGVLIATIFGPGGREGMVVQAVSWAIFAHLMAGMWAGYWLLADRTRRDLSMPGAAVLLVVQCASIDGTNAAAARLRELGAVEVTSDAPVSGPVRGT